MQRIAVLLAFSFAIFYNRADLALIASAVSAARTDVRLTNAQRTAATRIWNNGLSAWGAASVTLLARQEGDGDTRTLVIDVAQVSRAQFVDHLNQLAIRTGNTYMRKIAEDAAKSSGGQEPWP